MTTTILLVGDGLGARRLVRAALEGVGIAVVVAADAAQAVAAFAARPIALVLVDLALSASDAFEVAAQLRGLKGGAEVSLIALSGLISKIEESRISAVGFDDILSKPVDPARLLDLVRAHLPAAESVSVQGLFGTGKTALVVDDDPVQRKLIAFRMHKVGFRVVPASDGADALERAKTVVPDIVVSDVLMPRLDGFGLCLGMGRDERLARIPVVLTTNGYVEAPDRELARKAGASDLVPRTPDLREVLEAVRRSLGVVPPRLASVASDEAVEAERAQRSLRQLERQVALNAGVAQRCASLAAQLAVLNGISEALASDEDLDIALKRALAACFDAGGVSLGALYLKDGEHLRVIGSGARSGAVDRELESCFGERELLERAIATHDTVVIPAEVGPSPAEERLLSRAGAASALIVPLLFRRQVFGALLMLSQSRELDAADRILFAQAVAGQIGHALALTRAFEQQRASEHVARDQTSVLRSILESTADAVVVSDSNGRFIHWNPAATRIMRTTPISARPTEWSQTFGLFEPDQRTPVPSERLPLVRAMRGEAVERMEVFLRHEGVPEGVWLSINARPWLDAENVIRGGVAAFRDVTQEKNAHMQLMVSDRMASLGMLAAGVAHEINNPLASIVANLDLAERELRGELDAPRDLGELRELVHDARGAADRVRQIVRDLKIYSRHEDGHVDSVDLALVLESSIRMAWTEIRHRARLVKQYQPGLPRVVGTESRLGQVFLNLIVNAAQAIAEGDVENNSIRVACRLDASGRVAVEISDTGSGISPEALTRLFTPFFTTKPPGVGTGLGLAICQRIVTGFGGEIRVESEVGKGTTFRVLLPAAPSVAAASDRADTRAVLAANAHRRARVLVIDDDSLVASTIRRMLERDHEVVITNLAAAALALIRAGERFDVILCDLMMPQMTGMEFYAELERLNSALVDRVVFLTAFAFTPAAHDFLQRVPNEFVEKPFDVERLRGLVNHHSALESLA